MEILNTTPDNGATGIALEQVLSVVFDVEIDLDTILQSGGFIVVASANKLTSRGPGFKDLDSTDEDLLSSRVFSGLVEGTVSTEDSLTFSFSPTAPLNPVNLYRVILGTSVLSRTIEAVLADGGNTSTGSLTTKGPYTGSDAADTWTIEVTSAGLLGTATFNYTRTSSGLTSEGIPTDRLVELEDGVFLKFTSGNFVLGDTWTFVSTPGVPLDDIYEFSFTTGAFTHVEVSEDIPSFQINVREIEGINRIDQVPSVDSGTFGLSSITPDHQATNIPLSKNSIVLTFSKPIDPDSITDAVIEILMESLPLEEAHQSSTKLKVTPTVSGNTLTLTFTG